MQTRSLESIVTFLHEIGISIREEELGSETFLPGICISNGTLIFDRQRLKWPGDLLHEAGHLAVAPSDRRYELDDRLTVEHEIPDAGEIEAMAWSFAAAVHLSLPLTELFHEGGYRGKSPSLILSYSVGVYPGAAGLARAGMTAIGETAYAQGVAAYPQMLRWLRA
jgi:hypothetical protein